jgi:hypothetical protein
MKKFRLIYYNFICLLILLFVSFYLFEFYLSYKNISKKNHKFELIKKTTQKKNNFWTVFPNTLIKDNLNIFPLSGYSHINTYDCDEEKLGYYSNFMSDRYGFRNDDVVWDKKKKNFFIR